jgi:hypothetical protein
MKKLRLITILLLIIFLLSLAGCTGVLDKSKTLEDDNPILAGDTAEQQPISCMVYFSLPEQHYLVGQQHFISVPETKRIEEVILQELIAGPTVTTLKSIINPNTRIVSISDNKGLLFVTLSHHFLEPHSGVPKNWEEDETWYSSIMKERQLALYSIVNTLTQMGKYSKIQLYIAPDNSTEGERPTRAEMGFEGEDGEQLLEPLGRNTEVMYQPKTAIESFLISFKEKNWEKASLYVDNKNIDGNNLPSQFSLLNLTLIYYEITSWTTSYDGQSAIVTIDYNIRAKDGVEYDNTNVSLLVERVDDIWKISYTSVNQLLNVSNG